MGRSVQRSQQDWLSTWRHAGLEAPHHTRSPLAGGLFFNHPVYTEAAMSPHAAMSRPDIFAGSSWRFLVYLQPLLSAVHHPRPTLAVAGAMTRVRLSYAWCSNEFRPKQVLQRRRELDRARASSS